jgi:hypothetical protein
MRVSLVISFKFTRNSFPVRTAPKKNKKICYVPMKAVHLCNKIRAIILKTKDRKNEKPKLLRYIGQFLKKMISSSILLFKTNLISTSILISKSHLCL